MYLAETQLGDVIGETTDAAEAVAIVQSLKPDIVVIGIMLPGLDGIETARQIKCVRHATTIVVNTFGFTADYLPRARDVGADAVISKIDFGREMETFIKGYEQKPAQSPSRSILPSTPV